MHRNCYEQDTLHWQQIGTIALLISEPLSRELCATLKPMQQYAARLHAEKLKRCLYQSQKAAGGTLGTKAFNMRLCPEDVSDRLTGFQHNAVTPIGSASPDMPIVLSDRYAGP